MTIAIAAAVAIIVAAALVHFFLTARPSAARFNGAAIVAAARDYTRELRAANQPIPNSISLEQLVALHYLKPGQVEVFQGLKATLQLSTTNTSAQTVVMRVLMQDGEEVQLLGDGSVHVAPPLKG
jgi:hypothetical protein